MEIIRQQTGKPEKIGVLAGSFNPATCAHLALARAGLEVTDEVFFALPRQFPHKTYEGASIEERLAMLRALVEENPRFGIAIPDSGLFVDIAGECRQAFGDVEVWFLCGRDAAERIVTWDYGVPGAIDRMLEEFGVLVAARGGNYEPPAHLRGRIRALNAPQFDDVSSTEVRRRIARGEEWRDLVPYAVADMAASIYKSPGYGD